MDVLFCVFILGSVIRDSGQILLHNLEQKGFKNYLGGFCDTPTEMSEAFLVSHAEIS